MKPGLKVITCVAREQGSKGAKVRLRIKTALSIFIMVGRALHPHVLNTEDTSWSCHSQAKNPGVGVEVGWGRELLTS